ncbi:MAG: ATP-binding cassette domain-containing protein, partial [Pseudomonadota bacterium]
MSILSVQDIAKRYKFREVVRGISLEIKSGEVVGLLGPNGAGKTTAFYMIVGLVRCDRGRILLDGNDLTHDPMHRRSAMGLG